MLKISKNVGLTDIVSAGNPISSQHPISGSTETIQVYLFNDDATKRYESVTVNAIDTTGPDESNWVKLSTNGTTFTDTINFAEIKDTVGHLFYVRVTTPSVADTQNKTDIKLSVVGTEFAV
ncbi:hypothetical protein CWR48_10635 [Oceanobacillus arenosus]|uniref:Uncharacterized protein n=1 Tax=Oceanobacillus arenosus TaxID=1229153 RepID=A0A3D8PQR3_9BACI|nr:hypothetical protein [Oceanobacillus arenosus]RDW18052.1 hypothetical protein CWR48_10635 [Oceanobacillus arenosus]